MGFHNQNSLGYFKILTFNNNKMEPKNTWIILICAIIFFNSGFAQFNNAFEGIKKDILSADSLMIKNQPDKYIDQFKKEMNTNSSGNMDLNYYNLAVCYSTKKQTDSTCYYLSKCIGESSNYNNLVLTDTDFEFLHQHQCWEKIGNKIDSVYLAQNSEVTNKELAVELYHIFLKDQHARGLGLKRMDKSLVGIDKENLKRVEEIIQQYGWPTYSMVGKTSADGAFLAILHSNITTQRKYFKQIFDAAKKSEASKESVALLFDRINIHIKGWQMFGTQVYQIKDSITGKHGSYKYFPIKNEEKVDSLRKEVGLIPLKQYYALFGIDYKPVAK